jgi:hypothetical protein
VTDKLSLAFGCKSSLQDSLSFMKAEEDGSFKVSGQMSFVYSKGGLQA